MQHEHLPSYATSFGFAVLAGLGSTLLAWSITILLAAISSGTSSGAPDAMGQGLAFTFVGFILALPIWVIGITVLGLPALWLAKRCGGAPDWLGPVLGAVTVGAVWMWVGSIPSAPWGFAAVGALVGAVTGFFGQHTDRLWRRSRRVRKGMP